MYNFNISNYYNEDINEMYNFNISNYYNEDIY